MEIETQDPYTLTTKEMFDANYKNYEWENLQYQVPSKYPAPHQASQPNLNPGKLFGLKTNFLD